MVGKWHEHGMNMSDVTCMVGQDMMNRIGSCAKRILVLTTIETWLIFQFSLNLPGSDFGVEG